MIIYESTRRGFIADVESKRLQGKLEQGFTTKTGGVPADKRVWESEYSDFAWDLREADVADDVQVAVEFHLSGAGRFRLDVVLGGHGEGRDRALIVELKGWEEAEATAIPDLVRTPLGGAPRLCEHPSAQALGYREFLEHFNADIEARGIQVDACSYLLRLRRRDPEPLELACYEALLARAPMFLLDDRSRLREHLSRLVPEAPRTDVIEVLERGRLRPSRQLADAVVDMLRGNDEFRLMDEQRVAFQAIWHHVLASRNDDRRRVFVVRGGPGTGKSVIAIRLLSKLYERGVSAFFVAPNAAFRKTLATRLAEGSPELRRLARLLLQSAYRFHDRDWNVHHDHEVLIVDEAHRLKSGKVYQYAGSNMVTDTIRAAKTTVFFVDETQQVTWNDCGSVAEITREAATLGVVVEELPQLEAQFRCNGSTGYLNWIDDVLQIRSTGNFDRWGDGQYDFQVFDDAAEMYAVLRTKNTQNRARLIAGYAWDWPRAGRARGTTERHVVAGELRLPWNYDGENWATSEDGITQVGCVHTSQGVEFDWVGILIGKDLVYRDGAIRGMPEDRARTDKSLYGYKRDLTAAKGDAVAQARVHARAQAIIKNTYKVLLTRGQRGCLVWCEDAELRAYLRARQRLACSNADTSHESAVAEHPDGS